MLYFDKIDVCKGIDVNKVSKSEECNVCHYWCFLNKGFNLNLVRGVVLPHVGFPLKLRNAKSCNLDTFPHSVTFH